MLFFFTLFSLSSNWRRRAVEVLSLRSTLPCRASQQASDRSSISTLGQSQTQLLDLFVLFVLDIIILLSEALCPDLNVSTRG